MFIYRVVTQDEEEYWVDEPYYILDTFGTVIEVTKFLLSDPEDITDEINKG